mgnify:FL=1
MPLQDPQLLREQVQEAFEEGGILSQATQQFQPRTGQTAMALAVADVIDQGGSLVVEAGTEIGRAHV